ncbi:MAG: hypothetical protein NC918_02670 [Candidatus Omnitrophica bacterium]|nr:hypothetical protein [Candidatus Omnitrophota bacterium]
MEIGEYYKKCKIKGFWVSKNIFILNPLTEKIEMLKLEDYDKKYKFSWGDNSKGTKLLALALLKYFATNFIADLLHIDFAENKLSKLPQKDFEITADYVRDYVIEYVENISR